MNRIRRRRIISFLCLVGTGSLCLAAVFLTVQPALGRTPDCQFCHDEYLFHTKFPESIHGNNGCTSCHVDIRNINRHMTGKEKPPPVSCGKCHQEIARKYEQDFHYIELDFRCYDCHQNIHAIKANHKNIKQAIIEKCTECHGNEEYVASGHGEAVLRGNQDAAACSDCHGLHDIRVFHTPMESYPAKAREFYTQKCKYCHVDEAMMKRNHLSAKVVHYYEETYHGKIQKIGYPAEVAGCADCHTSHNILPSSDPRSPVNPVNLVSTCGQCHKWFHPRFVNFTAHPDYEDIKRYPLLFLTYVFMAALLASVFFFFWLHTALWWRKAYWEKCLRAKMGAVTISPLPECDEVQQIQRFSIKERIMHILLIISFFTLVMTGIPLKYAGSDWSKLLIRFWGGAFQAGVFHRVAAVILTALFMYTVWLSLKFLFPKGEGTRGWIARLLGPDSLCPNMKDWKDIKGMIRWFFDRGEMPRFDRWTYWEKFDFFAVFWGMTAIAGSGLILWFPEWFSWIMPGWMINVATIVHSEEALLAALFIFTVHFFNNHLVPNKFPLEPNIFTGRTTLKQLQEERPLEYERLVAEGRLDSLKRGHPSILTEFLTSAFGLASLLLGLLLTVLIIRALIFP